MLLLLVMLWLGHERFGFNENEAKERKELHLLLSFNTIVYTNNELNLSWCW